MPVTERVVDDRIDVAEVVVGDADVGSLEKAEAMTVTCVTLGCNC